VKNLPQTLSTDFCPPLSFQAKFAKASSSVCSGDGLHPLQSLFRFLPSGWHCEIIDPGRSGAMKASQPSHTKPIQGKKRALYRKVSKKIEISAVWALQIHDLQGFLVSVAFGFQLPCSSLRRN
jgi:hypothetical protein